MCIIKNIRKILVFEKKIVNEIFCYVYILVYCFLLRKVSKI